MSGPDTIRGFNFQHAIALHAALDLLDDPTWERIEIEGDDDVVDFQILGAHEARRRVSQVKSRSAAVGPQDIVNVVERWRGLSNADEAQFEFTTDAHLSPTAAAKLVPPIQRLAVGEPLDTEQDAYLQSKGLGDDHDLMARVRVAAQQPPVGALLSQAELRVLDLLGSHRAASLDNARATVDHLFRVISTTAGEGERNLRQISREQVAEIIGVDLASIDADAGWTPERAEQYRKAVLEEPRDAAVVELGLDPVGPEAPLVLVEGRSKTTLDEPATKVSELIDEERGAAVTGRGGSGKTTALSEIAIHACQRDLIPIVPELVAYRAGSLRRLLHQEIEVRLRGPLGPRGLDAVLASGQVMVLADSVTERPDDEAAELLLDLAALERDWPVRIIASGRQSFRLRAGWGPVYQLQGLDWQARDQVAEELMADGADAARQLADSLGDVAEVPLLFRMGLSLLSEGRDPRSVEQLYAEFVTGLAARAGVPRPDAALAAGGLCSLELVAEGRFDADAYWWRASMRQALDALADGRVFDVSTTSAEGAIAALVEIGLLYERGAAGQLAFLHDSFRDYLAARTLIEGHFETPDPLDERYEQVADLLAQGTAEATSDLLLRLADNPVAAARAAQLDLDLKEPSHDLTQALLRHLTAGFSVGAEQPAPARLGLTEWSSDEHYYIAIHDGDGHICQSREEFQAAIVQVVLVAAYPERPSSLRVAVLAWQELLRAELRRAGRSGRPMPIPSEGNELAASIVTHFEAKVKAVSDLAEALCPALSERIVDVVGWRGLRACLDAEGQLDELSGDPTHGLAYTYDWETVTVEVGEPAEAVYGGRTTAEHFMHLSPESEASAAVSSGLKKLLATWGP